MPHQTTNSPLAADVLDFWFADGVTLGWPTRAMNKRWFRGGHKLDADITARFGARVREAVAGGLQHWEKAPLDRLALVILLDQFTRNVFRGTGQAFQGDARAGALVLRTLTRREDLLLPLVGRLFLYMPLMHAESVPLQQECVARISQLLAEAPTERKKDLQASVDSARQHRDIIARFGRFPYRNKALGRTSTSHEESFLQGGPRFGQ